MASLLQPAPALAGSAVRGRANAMAALVILIALSTVAFHLSGPLGPDVSWLITVAERMLDGQVLYVDILEPNPPMAAILYMPPVALAHLFGVRAEPFVVLYTAGFGLVMLGVSARIASSAGLLKRADLFWPVVTLLVVSGWGEEFGQREHFAVMAALPFLACVALRGAQIRPSKWQWSLAGACGGLILCIKPHFALVLLLPAVVAAVRQRGVRPLLAPELWLAGGAFLAYIAAIWLFLPAFFTDNLPVAAAIYVPDRRDLGLLLLGFRKRIWASRLLAVLVAGAIGFGASYLAQGKGFTYHIMPGTALLGVAVLMAFVDGAPQRQLLRSSAAIVAAALMALVPVINDVRQWQMRAPLQDALMPYGPGLRIASMLPDLSATSPLHRILGAELVNSGPLTGLSTNLLKREKHPDAAWLSQIDAHDAAERVTLRHDIERRPPDIIVTSRDGFDWPGWAQQDAGLAALLGGYDEIGEVPFDGYKPLLLKRHGLLPPG